MTMTDPIADMLTRIRNANMVKYKKISMPSSKLKVELAKLLKEEGYIQDYSTREEGIKHFLDVELKYSKNGSNVIHGLKRVSKPGCRVYSSAKEVPGVLGGLGISILSTSRGIMTGKAAKQQNVGGELLCSVW